MKLYLYTLNPSAARPMKLTELRRVVEQACRYVEVSSNHQVSFAEDKGQARLIGTPTIDFSFADFGDSDAAAKASGPVLGKYEIMFSYNLNWSTRAYHPWRLWRIFKGPSHELMTFAVHEIGHVLGMYRRLPSGASQHNPDKWSVMNERPITYKFTDTDLGTLRYITHPGYKDPT
jgi:hypothetical protein